MKRFKFLLRAILAIFSITLFSTHVDAQLLKRIKEEVKSRAENKAVREVGNATEKTMDKAKDEAIGATKGGKGKNASIEADHSENTQAKSNTAKSDYKSYDFVPGDKIIFQPDLNDEADAELPARKRPAAPSGFE